jgi:hypothetical protein
MPNKKKEKKKKKPKQQLVLNMARALMIRW